MILFAFAFCFIFLSFILFGMKKRRETTHSDHFLGESCEWKYDCIIFFFLYYIIVINCCKLHLPSSKSLMSFAAWMPSSFRFFSICLERCMAARSSADVVQPILLDFVAFSLYYLLIRWFCVFIVVALAALVS